MAATSITGRGLGDSGGEYKPELQSCSACGCGPAEESEPTPRVKRGCVTRIKSSNKVSYGSSSRKSNFSGC